MTLYTLFDYAAAAATKSLQSCPTLCDPMDGSPPASAVPGILQARTLEWVADRALIRARVETPVPSGVWLASVVWLFLVTQG